MAEQDVRRESAVYKVSKYYLLYMLLALLGWLWETFYVYLEVGRFTDRGFMSLPFCPIYGTALLTAYFLLGTPQEGRGLLKKVNSPIARYFLYLAFAFVIPTATELFIGLFFDRVLGVELWDYSYLPLNFKGYVCLPVSLVWAAAILLFMRFVFPLLKRIVFAIPNKLALAVSTVLFVAMVWDAAVNFINL